MPTFEILDYGSPDGSQWGNASTDKLGFYGLTPVAQQSIGENLSTVTHVSSLTSSLVIALKTIGIIR